MTDSPQRVRPTVNDYQYYEPKTIAEALELLDSCGQDARVLAGGTDLILDVKHRRQTPGTIVCVNSIEEMNCIQETQESLRIGGAVTHARVSSAPVVKQKCTMLAEGSGCVGSVQIRNVATIGGNICNALPCADTMAPLAAAGANVLLASKAGFRQMPVSDFVLGPRKTQLKPGELLVEFIVPIKPPLTGSAYAVHTTRKALDLTIAGIAATLSLDPASRVILDAGIALANSSPRPMRIPTAEDHLKGKEFSESLAAEAGELVGAAAKVRTSILRATAEYRRDMLKVMTRRALLTAYERALAEESMERK